MIRTIVTAAAMIVVLAGSAAAAQTKQVSQPYLSETLKVPAYKAAFDALFRDERKLPAWLPTYVKTRSGVEIPGRLEGGNYELYGVCEPHNCADSYIFVLFVPGGRQAWGVLITPFAMAAQMTTGIRSPHYRFFGSPGPQQQRILTAAKW